MKPTVAIGDIHGLNYWKEIVERHKGCRFVFLGDYLDPHQYIPRKEVLRNLQEIIGLKKDCPDDVILLLGNHDLHYFSSDAPVCTRFDFQIAEKASHLFVENFDLFRYAYQEGSRIFTHAGISHKWFEEDFQGEITQPIADQLNHPSDNQIAALCCIGQLRGGAKGAVGGIFWADIDELADPLHGFTQIVGHNRVKDVKERSGNHENKIVFCDCLWNGNYLILDEG
ncbi:MAG: metallophosphoesterase [Candidatus Phocaeicola excrementipullorum]|uniref:Metallophosphoesterase n=1 Tax=Candidatus Phocaeicola excrementipullorum TaxID=2838731 RepID=A0A948X2G5_9BACT|nr:metallophosphoesterase [Candidatus Phocaeicola excrementipullorum]